MGSGLDDPWFEDTIGQLDSLLRAAFPTLEADPDPDPVRAVVVDPANPLLVGTGGR